MGRITADMLISDVLASCPGSVDVFERHGLACAGCLASSMESLSAVADVHEVSVELLIAELNALSTDEDPYMSPEGQ